MVAMLDFSIDAARDSRATSPVRLLRRAQPAAQRHLGLQQLSLAAGGHRLHADAVHHAAQAADRQLLRRLHLPRHRRRPDLADLPRRHLVRALRDRDRGQGADAAHASTARPGCPSDSSLGLSQMLESKVWPTSAPTNTPWLGGGTSVTPTVAGAIGAVGAIEDKILAAAAGAGTIHMAPSVALAAGGLVLKDDGVGGFRTVSTGSKVIVGNYPPGKVAGHIGNIDVYVGPSIYEDETFDRATNEWYPHAWIEAAARGTPARRGWRPSPET